jgi:hypothetical protein
MLLGFIYLLWGGMNYSKLDRMLDEKIIKKYMPKYFLKPKEKNKWRLYKLSESFQNKMILFLSSILVVAIVFNLYITIKTGTWTVFFALAPMFIFLILIIWRFIKQKDEIYSQYLLSDHTIDKLRIIIKRVLDKSGLDYTDHYRERRKYGAIASYFIAKKRTIISQREIKYYDLPVKSAILIQSNKKEKKLLGHLINSINKSI